MTRSVCLECEKGQRRVYDHRYQSQTQVRHMTTSHSLLHRLKRAVALSYTTEESNTERTDKP